MMAKHSALLLSLACALTTVPLRAAAAPRAALGALQEVTLPQFKLHALADDLPARDLAVGEGGRVYVLGAKALWTWQTKSRQLSRLSLPRAEADTSPLERLGTDGTSLFVASRASLFQLDLGSGRTFRFQLPQAEAGETVGFAGEGDLFHWLNTAVIARFDRYGRRVDAVWTPPTDRQDGPVHLDVTKKTLWFVRGNALLRARMGEKGFEQAFKAKHPIVDMVVAEGEIILHTAHTVLRLNEKKARLIQAIPVEGHRRLVAMHITKASHAYVFDDQLVEIYDLASQATRRLSLPLARQEKITRFVVADDLVLVAVGREVRAFRQTP